MYLKRLELKGFKSFAQRTVLNMEPGVSAIVGPNGSGKSNICDAILWVLGERNAKNLRGGIMEDVIFAGSSARDAVSVAEVSLVLDNSDHTLPVDYSEVSISRRMFRSGESDYLINGTIARRLDVLDILHDSGMGSDTNSIISQGNLESVLHSQPAERRALIEEAAGILKHKQRMTRSNNKLERMNLNLERIGDVMAEIERQLKPLRIKAKRAAAYDNIMEELNGLNLELAVDDLKQIHAQWQDKNKTKEELETKVRQIRMAMDDAKKTVHELQTKISSQNEQIVEHANKQRRLSNYVEKLDASIMVLQEKQKNAKLVYDQLSGQSQGGEDRAKQSIEMEISALQNQITGIEEETKQANANVEAATAKKEEAQAKLKELESIFNQLLGQQKSFSDEHDDIQKKLKVVEDDVLKARSKIQALKNIIADYEVRSKEATQRFDEANKKLQDLTKSYDEAAERIQKLESQSEECSQKVVDCRTSVNEAETNKSSLESELSALNSLIAKLKEQENSSQKWLQSNKSSIAAKIGTIADEITVEDEYVGVVESILGSYAQGFSATAVSDISDVFKALKSSESDGRVKFVMYGKNSNDKAKAFAESHNAVILGDKIKVGDGYIASALNDVVVFQTALDAIGAYSSEAGVTCASLDGTVLWSDGRVNINIVSENAKQDKNSGSIISYKKQARKLQHQIDKATKILLKAQNDLEDALKKDDELSEKLFQQKSEFAQLTGQVEAAKNNVQSLQANAEDIKKSLEKSKHNKQLLSEAYSANAPEIEKYKKRLGQLDAQTEASKKESNQMFDKLDAQRQVVDNASHEENEAKLEALKNSQVLSAKKDQLRNSKEKIDAIEWQAKQNSQQMHHCEAISARCSALLNVLKFIANDGRDTLHVIDNSTDEIDVEAKRMQAQFRQANETLDETQKRYEEIRCELNDVEVDLGGIKVRVQSAVDVINDIDGISVDSALCMDDIEDRQAKETRSFKLKRRIENMGPINPEAQAEYQEMYDRYKFLQSQIDDINTARVNLDKINRIIELRMKDDFIDTFKVVNNNFQDIFSSLFPGGKAKLELDDTKNPETCGVEVKAQPKGKRISKMTLMSGGEKSLVALCLLFAVYKTRTTPFYILDEVEAALDDTNLRRLIHYLDQLRNTTQLIMITHQRRTMEMADTLFGVSMRSDGITKVVTQKLDSALRYANSQK